MRYRAKTISLTLIKQIYGQIVAAKTRCQITAVPAVDENGNPTPLVLAKGGISPPLPKSEHNQYMLRAFDYMATQIDEMGSNNKKSCTVTNHGSGHPVGNFFRGGEGISYSAIFHDATEHLKVEQLTSRYTNLDNGLCLAELDRLSSNNAKLPNQGVRFEIVNRYIDDLERKILAKLMVVAYEKRHSNSAPLLTQSWLS